MIVLDIQYVKLPDAVGQDCIEIADEVGREWAFLQQLPKQQIGNHLNPGRINGPLTALLESERRHHFSMISAYYLPAREAKPQFTICWNLGTRISALQTMLAIDAATSTS